MTSPLLLAQDTPLPATERPALWALASGKGGVGKSLLAANLGCLLADSNWSTTVVDLDLEGANLHTYLGVSHKGRGLDDVLGGRLELADAVQHHPIPGLHYLLGSPNASGPLPQRTRRALISSLRDVRTRAVLMDLGTGTGQATLDFFQAADVPLLVITPEPASVENAHRFLRALYLDRVKAQARRRGQARRIAPILDGLGTSWRPEQLLEALAQAAPDFLPHAQRAFGDFVPHLVVNQARQEEDVEVGFALVEAVRRYFGVKMKYVGALAWDPAIWFSVRRRRLLLRGTGEEGLSPGLSLIADNVVEGGTLTPGAIPWRRDSGSQGSTDKTQSALPVG